MMPLNIEDLSVESFTTGGATEPSLLGATAPGEAGCEQVYFMPVTAHTDACDVCCQPQ